MPGDSKRAALFDPDRVLESFKTKVSQEGIMTYLEYLVTQRKSEVSLGPKSRVNSLPRSFLENALTTNMTALIIGARTSYYAVSALRRQHRPRFEKFSIIN